MQLNHGAKKCAFGTMLQVHPMGQMARPSIRAALRAAIGFVFLLGPASRVGAQCAGCDKASFGSAPRSYSVPYTPYSVVAADLNGDGSLDVAAALSSSPTSVVVWLGTPSGSLGPPTSYSLGVYGYSPSLVVADFDGDGHPDLLVAAGSTTLYLFHGYGDGKFSAPSAITTASSNYLLATGDFNGDGISDIASTDGSYSSNVNILVGNGAGGFLPAITIPAGPNIQDLRMADLNRDGLADIVAANNGTNTVSVILGVVMGPVAPARDTIVGNSPSSVAFGDWNRDGKLDLAVANYEHGLTVLQGDGAGGLTSPTYFPTTQASDVVAGDFNGDGNIDLAASNSSGGLVVLAGNGSGGFSVLPSRGAAPSLMVAADMDRDGFSDLVGAVSTEVMIYFGSAGSPPLSSEVYTIPIYYPNALTIADFNGDGKPDIAVVSSGQAAVLLSNLSGGFTPGTPFSINSGSASFAAATDLNHDGKMDLIVTNSYGSTVAVYLGNGDGSFSSGSSAAVGSSPVWISVADFNGDGRPDLAVANSSSNSVSILLGKGDGTFQPQAQFSVGSSPNSIAVADFNGDGKLDIAVSNNGSSTVAVLLGNGSGGFSSISIVSVGSSPTSIVAADFNGDGKADIALLTGNSPRAITMLPGDGSGGFGAAVNLTLSTSSTRLAVADFNQDGRPDLVAAASSYYAGSPTFYMNDGAGGFLPPVSYFAGQGPTGLAVGDFDLNGLSDVAVLLGNYPGSVAVLRNTNCEVRRLGLSADVPSCTAPGSPFAAQPVVTVLDDGGNVVPCNTELVSAAILPGTGKDGATLGGKTSVFAIGGEATFTDLSVNLAGRGYILQFSHPNAGVIRSRPFSQGVTVVISGPVSLCTGDIGVYDAGPGYDSYQWTVDSVPAGSTQKISVNALAPGTRTVSVTAVSNGCAVSATFPVTVSATPAATITALAAVCPYSTGNAASVPNAGPGATYAWALTNAIVTSGAGTSAITFHPGPSGSVSISVAVTNGSGCSAISSKAVTIDPTLSCAAPVGFFTVAPCRVADTRNPVGPSGGPALSADTSRTFPIVGLCGIPSSARAIAANLAVVLPTYGGDLRAYPADVTAPLASSLNFRPGIVRANNAIVPLGASGQITIQCDMSSPSGATNFFLDVYGYFQ